jgi:hypothetical protein
MPGTFFELRASMLNLKNATVEELLRMIGSGRSDHSAVSVAAAEAELVRRTAGEEELFRRKVRRSGTICAVVGGLVAAWGLLLAVLGVTTFGSQVADFSDSGSFPFRHFEVIYVGGAVLEAVAGLVLLVGGLTLRRLDPRGRLLILGVLWLAFGFIVVFTLAWVGNGVFDSSLGPLPWFMVVAGIANSLFWGFLLWLPYRFFASKRLRAACVG